LNFHNLKVPILQAPIEATANLAAAVSNAGRMGSLGLAWKTADSAARLVDEVLSKTQNPFFANFVLAFDPVAFDAVIEAGVPSITLSWGVSSDLISRAHHHNVQIGVQVGTLDGAKEAISNGADFIICQGIEAGGHVQSSTKLSILLLQILECSNGTPVIAAGGISDKDDVDGIINEGASAVMLGTRFVATQESDAHPLYKAAIINAKGSDTVSTTCFDGGWPNAMYRVIRNKLFSSWESAGCPQPGNRPGEDQSLAEERTGYKLDRVVQRPFNAVYALAETLFMEGLESKSLPKTPWASAGAYTTAGDLANFGQMFLNEGEMNGVQILSPATVAYMTRNQTSGLPDGDRDETLRDASRGIG
jgi:nitronate monooxygenase